MGVPQGGSLGPIVWNVITESWFEILQPLKKHGVHAQAFADDSAVLIDSATDDAYFSIGILYCRA